MVNFSGNFIQQRERNSDRASNGGRIFFANNSDAFFGVINTAGSEAYIRFTNTSAITIRGHFVRANADSGLSGLWTDHVAGSGTNASFTYGATMVSQILPFAEILPTSGGAAGKYHCISASTSSGFSVEYPAGNCEIFVWAPKVS
jgi:hypothetical protein